MSEIDFDAAKPLFKPITVKISGKVFTVRKVDREVIRALKKFAKMSLSGDPEAAHAELEFLIGKDPIIDSLDVRDVGQLLVDIAQLVFKSEKFEDEETKNESKPGDKK